MGQLRIDRPRDRDFLLYVRRSDYDLELTQLIAGGKRDLTDLLREYGVIVFKGYGIDQPGKSKLADGRGLNISASTPRHQGSRRLKPRARSSSASESVATITPRPELWKPRSRA